MPPEAKDGATFCCLPAASLFVFTLDWFWVFIDLGPEGVVLAGGVLIFSGMVRKGTEGNGEEFVTSDTCRRESAMSFILSVIDGKASAAGFKVAGVFGRGSFLALVPVV